MLALTRWCIAHRRPVAIAWILVAIAVSVAAQLVGRSYTTNYTLPGTQSQQARNLLQREFPTQGGDNDSLVFHTSTGTIYSAPVRNAITRLLARAATLPHVDGVISPYSSIGAVQVSPDHRTAFAAVHYDKLATVLPANTGTALLTRIHRVHVPGLSLAAGGQVIENAEGFSIGPATAVGVLAALVILLMTFGTLLAAGLPLITAGAGLITGVAVIGLATQVMAIPNVAPNLALMIGLGVGIDYALFIVTRFRESYAELGDVTEATLQAMDTSGRAILLAGTTVVIALLGMFATGVAFMYGLSIASVVTVLLTLLASLTLLPALLSRFGARLAKPSRSERRRQADGRPPRESLWRRWSERVQARPWPLAVGSLAVMLLFVLPITGMRLQSSDAGHDAPGTSTHQAYDMLARGFGPGFNGPLAVVAELRGGGASSLPALRAAVAGASDVGAVSPPRISPSGRIAVLEAYPRSSPESAATTNLVNRLRDRVLPPLERQTGVRVLVGGFTAASIDFSHVLADKLPLFIGIVVVVSALLLFVIFRSLVIPLQAAAMNLLSIGGALGVTVLVFQKGVLAGPLGIQPGPIEPWVPVLMFAVVFGLSMDYEVFLVSRVREEWVRRGDASSAVADGIAHTGRVISAAAAIMICVFLSFLVGNERVLKEFGFGLAAAVFLDAMIVRCVLLPATLELLGPATWKLPRWLGDRLPEVNIEGSAARDDALIPSTREEREPIPRVRA
ncbi:MAG TPA: MMPL family transporter [Solirubrobacteraceae bacterium]|nr:MMPL family transporter [Solirubrobacteraceae bacterium]